ncbi:hypothetical protein DW876_02230 [Hungatella hathewayi]|nr:hypothetical protein DW876_02230 [Hungatella hathewayi]
MKHYHKNYHKGGIRRAPGPFKSLTECMKPGIVIRGLSFTASRKYAILKKQADRPVKEAAYEEPFYFQSQ